MSSQQRRKSTGLYPEIMIVKCEIIGNESELRQIRLEMGATQGLNFRLKNPN